MTSSSDLIEIPATIAVHVCDECDEKFSLNGSACPRCGAPAEPQAPESVGINKAKTSALGDLLPRFVDLANVDSSRRRSMSVTDEQIIFFLNHSDAWERLKMDRLQDMATAVDVTTEERAKSKGTRAAFEALLLEAAELRRLHDSLGSVRPAQGLGEFIDLLLEASAARLKTYEICARFLLATTVEDVTQLQIDLQSTMDQATVAAHGLSEQLDRGQVHSDDAIQARLAMFTGHDNMYESAGRVDFAQVLIDGMTVGGPASHLGELAKPYFGSALTAPAEDLPEELSSTLYVTAAAVATSQDPITLRLRAESLAGIIRDAFAADPKHMRSVFIDAQPDIEDAMVSLLSVGDIALLSNLDDLPREALRLALSQHYGTLAEAVFRRLVNVIVAAKFSLSRNPEPYVDTARRSFGDKSHILSQEKDRRYIDCLKGVASVARNAGAHGNVDLSGDRVIFTQADRKGRVEREEFTDEEFHERVLDLVTTCFALRVAYDGVYADLHNEIGDMSLPTRRRVVVELCRTLIGRWGLSRAVVGDDEDGLVVVSAVCQEPSPRVPVDYLPAAFTLATLLRTAQLIELRIVSGDSEYCRIRIAVDEALRFQGTEEDDKFFVTLRIMYLAAVEPRDGDVEQRYRREFLTVIARSIAQRLSELVELRGRLPGSVTEYEQSLRRTLEFCACADKHVSDLSPPSDETATVRGSLSTAIALLQTGLADYLARIEARDWDRISRGSEHLERAGTLLVPLIP